jgi:hypothetical protein
MEYRYTQLAERVSRNTAIKRAHSDRFFKSRRGLSSPSSRWKGEPMPRLSDGQAILLILLLSLGLWVVIWGIFFVTEYAFGVT